jgi:phage terminase large subunit-like protein
VARGRPSKSLADLVREGTFRARRHHELLAEGELVRWKPLAAIQERYRGADNEFEQRSIAREFENEIPRLLEQRRRKQKSLDELLAKLGPPGSAEQAIKFFPWAFRVPIGPMAGKPARMPDYQQRFLREFYERDKKGRRIYTRGLLGVGKGNAKTPFSAGLGIHEIVSGTESPQAYALAGSREQAGSDPEDLSRMHALARHWAKGERLADHVRGSGRTIRCPERAGIFKILTSQGHLAQGVIPSLGLIEEFWQFVHKASVRP